MSRASQLFSLLIFLTVSLPLPAQTGPVPVQLSIKVLNHRSLFIGEAQSGTDKVRALQITVRNVGSKPITGLIIRWGIVKRRTGSSEDYRERAFGADETIDLRLLEQKTITTAAILAVQNDRQAGTASAPSETILGHGVQLLIGKTVVAEEYVPATARKAFEKIYPVASSNPNQATPADGPSKATHKVANALEGEELVATAKPMPGAPAATIQPMTATATEDWSGNAQLSWPAKAVNQVLTIRFAAPRPGRYSLGAWFTKTHDSGLIDISVNNRPVKLHLDLYAAKGVQRTDRIDLGVLDLKLTDNILQISIAGKNPLSDGFTVGLDVLALDPQP